MKNRSATRFFAGFKVHPRIGFKPIENLCLPSRKRPSLENFDRNLSPRHNLDIYRLSQLTDLEKGLLAPMEKNRDRYLAWLYFSIVYIFVSLFWVPAALLGLSIENSVVGLILYYLGGIGPAFSAILLLSLMGSKEERKDYWLRIINLRRVPLTMYVFILLYFPIVAVLASFSDVATGGRGGDISPLEVGLLNPLILIQSLMFLFLVGPFFEELGWRGYALPKLLTPYTALLSGTIIGTIWALWHLPLFFIDGTFQSELSFLSQEFWLSMADPFLVSIIIAWVFVNSNASTFSAMLFHFMENATGEMFPLSPTAQAIRIGLLVITVIALLILYDGKTFTKLRFR